MALNCSARVTSEKAYGICCVGHLGKLHNSSTSTQKEKYEVGTISTIALSTWGGAMLPVTDAGLQSELKREIEKLQRLREQIKVVWICCARLLCTGMTCM